LILTVIAVLSGCASYYSDDTGSVLLVGDSRVQMWPDELCEKMDAENKGVGGTTSAFSADVLAKETADYDSVIISVGINDATYGMDADYTIANMERAIIEAKRLSGNVFVTTIPGVRVAWGVSSERYAACIAANEIINAALPALAEKHGAKLIPLAELLNAENGELSPAYDDGSGIHFNADGYAVIYDLYMSYLGKE
jgi:lysophospholipase L1-like esterase